MMLAFLAFLICSATACEEGELHARTCAAGVAYLRDGLRAGQTLTIQSCIEGAP